MSANISIKSGYSSSKNSFIGSPVKSAASPSKFSKANLTAQQAVDESIKKL